ncbi:MAG: type II secretion system protein N [Quisquiliibacterium sp.]
MRMIPIPAIRSLSLPAWLATLALFGSLCAITGYWTVSLLAPRPPLAPGQQAIESGSLPELQQAALLFGRPSSGLTVAAASNIQVKGILAAGELGSAILAIDGKPARAYAVGEALGSGRFLAEVRSDAVVIASAALRTELPAPTTASLAVLTSGPNQPVSSQASVAPALRPLPPSGAAAAKQRPRSVLRRSPSTPRTTPRALPQR